MSGELAGADLSGNAGIKPSERPIRFGSEAHKDLFCRLLLDSFNPYQPAVIDWPELDQDTRARLASLPIWDIAVQTENRAGLNVAAYAGTLPHSQLKRTVELMGFEERRHRHVLGNLVQAYGITLKPEPAYEAPNDPEWAFLVTGYSECIDSFFAFGLFEIAKRSGFFPAELVDTFEPVINEEGRHIVFFVNWAAWHRRNLLFLERIRFEWKVLRVWTFLIRERIGLAGDLGGGKSHANFAVTGAARFGEDVTVRALLGLCLLENGRRLKDYDPRLKRPSIVPALARWARALLGR